MVLMRRLIRLRRLPWTLKTESELREKLAASGVLKDELLKKLRGVEFLKKASNPSELAATAILEFESDLDATKAIRAMRKGLVIDGVEALPAWRVGPAFTEAGKLQDAERQRREDEEDPLGMILREVDEASDELPTLEQLRDVYTDPRTDQWDIFQKAEMPGLMRPEWIKAAKERKALQLQAHDDQEAEDKRSSKEPHASVVQGQWAETIVKIDRVQKVVKGGTITKFRALVCCGNLMGAGGFAFGRAATPQDAIAKASLRAKENLFYIERYKGVALAHDVRGKHNNCIVNIYSVPPGYGTKGSSLGTTILNQLGFGSFTIKAHGRRTPASYVYATFEALLQLRSVEEVAKQRGRRLNDIEVRLNQGRKWPKNFRKFD